MLIKPELSLAFGILFSVSIPLVISAVARSWGTVNAGIVSLGIFLCVLTFASVFSPWVSGSGDVGVVVGQFFFLVFFTLPVALVSLVCAFYFFGKARH